MSKSINSRIMNDLIKINSSVNLGQRTSHAYIQDPARLVFTLSRYKFVAKMFNKFSSVLEIGAGDGFKAPIVSQFVKKLSLCDIEILNKKIYEKIKIINSDYFINDFVKNKINRKFDGIYFLDVFEHVKKSDEDIFTKNVIHSLKKNGALICGMPTLVSQKYASKGSKRGHVNCKDKDQLQLFFKKYFNNVFMFSMNDEVLHTGYDKMSHYIFALCTGKKNK